MKTNGYIASDHNIDFSSTSENGTKSKNHNLMHYTHK